MGRLFRVWRGDWKKNDQDQWHFVPHPLDFGFTIFMEYGPSFEVLEATVREHYDLGGNSPMVITYGTPDWMLFPSGQTPPITISTTADLVNVVKRRPRGTDVTLLVTFGAKSVAEFQFLSRSDFTIGLTTYVVRDSQDERGKAKYECLVFGERVLTSERVMTEIFGEEEMLIFHRVAMEMGYADRVLRPPSAAGVAQGMEIIQLDDDDEMVDVSHGVETSAVGTLAPNNGAMMPFQPQGLAPLTAADAPSVYWDVGLGLLDYPELYNTRRDGYPVSTDAAFWNGLIEECSQDGQEVSLRAIEKEMSLSLPNEDTTIGVNIGPGVGNYGPASGAEDDGSSSTGSTAIICSQPRTALVRRGKDVEGVGAVDGPAKKTKVQDTQTVITPTLTLTLACGPGGNDAGEGSRVDAVNTSSEGSETEGDLEDYGADHEVGMLFRNRDAFKHHMAMYAIAKKFCFRSGKSDPSMMILLCISPTCPWRVYAVRLKDAEVFEVRRFASEHSCSIDDRGGYHNQATASVIGELMKTKFAGTCGGPRPGEIRRMMRGDHNVSISYWKAWKSRDNAVEHGHGTCHASYIELPSYLNNLVVANPGTLATLHTESNDAGGQRFKYMFLPLGASIKGYEAMRKVVVVDGTHLKGKYAGCMLTASAQDGNYQIFPLAFAIVDTENDMSWEWFFQQLSGFVSNEDGLVVVSDRHPSIYKALSKVYPGAGHCVCVVHLKRNIRSNFRGKHLGYLVAKAARAYRLQDFYATFNEIKMMDPSCAEYLIEIGFEHWARSHFPGKRYNIMTSNLAESWNSVLREARELPIVPLIDFIRGKLMTWFATRRDAANKNGAVLTPRVLAIVTGNFEVSGGHEVVEIGEKEYEIRTKTGSSYHVNLGNMTCSCFEFQMLSIPCSHAVAAALKAKVSVDTLVIEPYKVSQLKRAYEGVILPVTNPVSGPEIPDVVADLCLTPPLTRRPPGRPKKLRYFSSGEKLMKRIRRRTSCSRCKGVGHNKATCKNPI